MSEKQQQVQSTKDSKTMNFDHVEANVDGEHESMKPSEVRVHNNESAQAIDLGTLQTDKVVSEEEAQEYLSYRKSISLAQRFGRFDKVLNEVLMHCFEKVNVFCIYLLAPETYSKLMREWIGPSRAIVKNLRPLNDDLSKLSKVQRLLHDEAIADLDDTCNSVFNVIDALILRVNSAYQALDKELFKKYEMRYYMLRSLLKKIKADFLRYYAEHLNKELRLQYAELAKKDYEEAYEGFLKLPNGKKSPYSLSCMLNYSVLLCDVFGNVDEAIQCANNILKETEEVLIQEDIKDKGLVQLMQIFRENAAIWNHSKYKDESSDSDDSTEDDEDDRQVKHQPSLVRSKTINMRGGKGEIAGND